MRPSVELGPTPLKALLSLRDHMARENNRIGCHDVPSFVTRKLRLIAHCQSVVDLILDDLSDGEEEELREEMAEEQVEAMREEAVELANDEAWSARQVV